MSDFDYSFSNLLMVLGAYITIGFFIGIGFHAVDGLEYLLSIIADKLFPRKHPKN